MPATPQPCIEIRGQLSEQDAAELTYIMSRNSLSIIEEEPATRSFTAVVAAVGWRSSCPGSQTRLQGGAGLAEDVINFLKKWRQKKAQSPEAQQPAQEAQQPAQEAARQPGLIVVVGPDQVPFDLTWASDDKVREFFCKHPETR